MYELGTSTRIRQGDIFTDIEFDFVAGDTLEAHFPYVVVISQDCDLEQDSGARNVNSLKHDAFLDTVLICPAFNADVFRSGEHLLGIEMQMESKGKADSTTWNFIKSNREPRYHFLRADPDTKLPELVVDFKRYYTVPRNALYDQYDTHFCCSVAELFRELLSQRFAYYLSRVGLPNPSDSVK